MTQQISKRFASLSRLQPIHILLFIVLIGAFLRLWLLGSVPAGLSNDESGYIYSSYSIWKTGHDVSGRFLPLSINLDNSFSPVYIYADAPFVGLFGVSPLTGRLPYALVGILSIPLVYLISKRLYEKEGIALLSAVVFALAPWGIQISRAALDANFALFFFLLGIALFLRGLKKGSLLWSLIPFLLGFYSYHATKLFFLFLIPFLFFVYRRQLLRRRKEALLFLIGCFLIFASFIFVTKTQGVTRQEVLVSANSAEASRAVNAQRQYTSLPFRFRAIVTNKATYLFQNLRDQYVEAFSPDFLFLHGEPGGLSKQYSLYTNGEFYIIEIVFLFAGLYALFRLGLNRILLGLIALSPLPSALSSDISYFNRSIMLLPFLSICMGLGIWYLLTVLKKRQDVTTTSSTILIGIFSVLCVSSYLLTYFFRFPYFSGEAWFVQSKDLSNFVTAQKQNYSHIIVQNPGPMYLMQYGIYEKIDPNIMQKAWRNYPNSQIGNVSLNNLYCSEKSTPRDVYPTLHNILVMAPGDCYASATISATIADKGEMLHVLWKAIPLR